MEEGMILFRGHDKEFCLDLSTQQLFPGREPNRAQIHLPRKQWELLRYLAESGGRPVSKEELIANVWGGAFVGDDAITQAVKGLRRALGDSADSEDPIIKTEQGRGYRFVQCEKVGVSTPPKRKPVDVTSYLTSLWNATRHIEIKNLRTSDGSANTFDIDLLYTPLTTVLPHQTPMARGERMEGADVPLQKALEESRLLLVGDPGAGKTTFLRRIAFEACHSLLGKEAERHVEPMLAERRFPVFVRAENLASGLPPGNSHELLFHFLDREHPEIGAAHFHEEFDKGCLLLLDGLDEIAAEALRDRTVEVLKGVANKYPKTRIVATSRPGVFGGVTTIAKFESVRVAPLDRAAKGVFIEKWGRAVYPADEAAAAELSRTLLSEVNAKKDIRVLAGNPVMLTALACLHFTHATLPEQRSELYWSVLEWLAKARAAKTGRDHNVLLALLRKLAFAMHAGGPKKRAEIERDEAIGLLAPEFQEEKGASRQREAAERFLLAEEVNSGIIVSFGDKIRFWHLTFQEALSADALAYDPDERQRLIFDEGRVHDPQWRETALLLAGELKKRGNDPVNKLLDKVLRTAEGRGRLRDVRCTGLMGALLKDLAAWKYTMPEPLEARYRAILDRALSIFDREKSQGISMEERLQAAEAMGQAGRSATATAERQGLLDSNRGCQLPHRPLPGDGPRVRDLSR